MLWPLFHKRQQVHAGGQVRVGAAELLRVRLPRCEQSPPPGSFGCARNTHGGGLIRLTGRQRIIPGYGGHGQPSGEPCECAMFLHPIHAAALLQPACRPRGARLPAMPVSAALVRTQVGSPAARAPICPAILSNAQPCTPRDSGTEGEGPALMVTAQARPPDAQTPAEMEPWTRSQEQPSRGPEALHTAQAHSWGSPLASGPQVKGLEPPGEGLVPAGPLSMPQCGVCKKPQ